MLCSQGTVGATKAGANMVAAAPAATAAVARWERVVGMARRAETLGGYYVMEQNAAKGISHPTVQKHLCVLQILGLRRLHDKKAHKSLISINGFNGSSRTCTHKPHDGNK